MIKMDPKNPKNDTEKLLLEYVIYLKDVQRGFINLNSVTHDKTTMFNTLWYGSVGFMAETLNILLSDVKHEDRQMLKDETMDCIKRYFELPLKERQNDKR